MGCYSSINVLAFFIMFRSQPIGLSDISSIMIIVLIINLIQSSLLEHKLNTRMDQEHIQPNCYMDCHSHLLDYPDPTDSLSAIQSALLHNVKHIVVNTTTSNQFSNLIQLMAKYEKILIGGFGIHPCFVEKQEQIQQAKKQSKKEVESMEVPGNENVQPPWIQQLEAVLKKEKSYSVGEIGLDFRKDVLQKNPKHLQMDYFTTQLALALKLGRPATIHCVRAHGQMLKIFKDLNKKIKQDQDRPHLIMHSYGGSEEITKSMLKLENLKFFFSLSLKRSQSLCSVIPVQNLVCETDSPCQNNIALLTQQNRLHLNTYLEKVKNCMKEKMNQAQIQIEKAETNEPINVISNIKSLVKYYQMDESKFTSIIFKNSLRAFKIIK